MCLRRAATLLALLAPGIAAGQCPPGEFEYGPVLDPHPEMIVLGHYGATDPLIPAAADYERAARDVGLIHAAIPATIGHMHGLAWEPNVLLIQTAGEPTQDLVCANRFYRAEMFSLCCGDWWVLVFPRSINVAGARTIYLGVPGVNHAGASVYGSTGQICMDSWTYEPNSAGVWRWSITESHAVFVHGTSVCFSEGSWQAATTSEGAITIACYANCDQSPWPQQLSVADYLCFLNRFAAGDSYANCNGSTAAPMLNINDFICFQQKFAAGCP